MTVCRSASNCRFTNIFGAPTLAGSDPLTPRTNPNKMHHLTDMNADKPKAVVLMSGGMDSCVTAAIASRTYRVAALHASYGQRTERRELECFQQLADHFGAFARLAVRLDHFAA